MNTKQLLNNPYVSALRNPINIAMLGLALAAGLCSAWWLFPAGVLLWGAMILISASDPMAKMVAQQYDNTQLAQRFRRPFEKIESAQVRIFRTIQNSPGRLRGVLSGIQEEVDEIVRQSFSVCLRMTALENNRITSAPVADLQARVEDITFKIETTQDPALKREYENTRRALQEQVDNRRRLDLELDRAEAQLTTIDAELGRVVAEVAGLQAARPEQAREIADRLLTSLKNQEASLSSIQ